MSTRRDHRGPRRRPPSAGRHKHRNRGLRSRSHRGHCGHRQNLVGNLDLHRSRSHRLCRRSADRSRRRPHRTGRRSRGVVTLLRGITAQRRSPSRPGTPRRPRPGSLSPRRRRPGRPSPDTGTLPGPRVGTRRTALRRRSRRRRRPGPVTLRRSRRSGARRTRQGPTNPERNSQRPHTTNVHYGFLTFSLFRPARRRAGRAGGQRKTVAAAADPTVGSPRSRSAWRPRGPRPGWCRPGCRRRSGRRTRQPRPAH